MRSTPQTYAELSDAYYRVESWLRTANAALKRGEGSYDLVRAMRAAESRASELRRLVHNHPDAPPQG